MPDEVREHLTRDQRPFLHPEYLQILQIHISMTVLLLFSSPHSFSIGCSSVFCFFFSKEIPIFLLFLRFVFGSLFGWKIQTWPIIRFLTESVTFRFFYLLVFDRISDAMCLNKMSRTSSRNIGPQHKNTAVYFIVHMGYFFPVCTKPILSVCC